MPDAVIHPTPQELTAFGLGKLPERAAAVVAAHLESCAACRQAVAGVSADSFLNKVRNAKQDKTLLPQSSAQPLHAPSSAGQPVIPVVRCPDVPPELASHSKYLILRELGRGGMGVVYQARQTMMNRQVVIKVVNRALLDRPDSLERFRREVQAAAQLSHRNIVTAYDAEQAGELHMLVMEFVPGQSLAEVLEKKGPLPVAHACHYMRQVALGLQHAHERGMVHRDIKPQNLMLMPNGQIKILDFGLAKVASERSASKGLTSSDACMGTPEYIAPEQAEDARAADIRADLYSLGCTLYCLLAGRPPFREDTWMKTVLAHLQKTPQPLTELCPDVPERLWRVVARLMAKDPAKRYQKPIEVVQALAPFVKPGAKPDAKAVSVPPAGASSPARGTRIAANTGEIKKILREVPGKTPPKEVPAKEKKASPSADQTDTGSASEDIVRVSEAAKPYLAPWWKRPGVLAVAVGISLALVLMAVIIIKVKVQTPNGDTGKVTSSKGSVGTPKSPPAEAFIVLEIDQPGAEVSVDERKIKVNVPGDNEPIKIEVEPGQRKLRISKDGFVAVTKDIELKTGESRSIKIRLVHEPPKSGEKGDEKRDREGAAHTATPQTGKIEPTESPPATSSTQGAKVEGKKEPPMDVKTPAIDYTNSLGMKFRLISAGKFSMGSSPTEIERCIGLKYPWFTAEQFEAEGPLHEVDITKPFYIGTHEVTVGQFRQFVKARDYKTQAEKEGGAHRLAPGGGWQIDRATNWRNPGFEQTDDHPVVCVSWNDAVAFCEWLSGKEGRKYRLPSEAEWEYCCRANTTTRFCYGDDENRLKKFANLADASFIQKGPRYPLPGVPWNDGNPFTAPVGHFQANAFGLYDMHGNVAEWCADWYDKDYYKNSPKQDPPGPPRPNARNERVVRGSAWSGVPTYCRSSFRNHPSSASSAQNQGFRVVLLPEKREAKADAPPQKRPAPLNPRPVDGPPPAGPRKDYDDLAKGRWLDVLPSAEVFNRLRDKKSYAGPEPPKFDGGVLKCNNECRLLIPCPKAKDVIVRASVKRSGPKDAGAAVLVFRNASDQYVVAYFVGDEFLIAKGPDQEWKKLLSYESKPYDDYFEFAFAVVEDRLIVYAKGRKILEARDDAPLDRPVVKVVVGTNGKCSALFRNIQVQVLDQIPAEEKGPSEKVGQPKANKAEPKKKTSRWDRISDGTVLTGTYLNIMPGGESGTATLTITKRDGNKVKGRYDAKAVGAAQAWPGWPFEGKIVGNKLIVKSVGNAAERSLTLSLRGDALEGTLFLLPGGGTKRVAFPFDK